VRILLSVRLDVYQWRMRVSCRSSYLRQHLCRYRQRSQQLRSMRERLPRRNVFGRAMRLSNGSTSVLQWLRRPANGRQQLRSMRQQLRQHPRLVQRRDVRLRRRLDQLQRQQLPRYQERSKSLRLMQHAMSGQYPILQRRDLRMQTRSDAGERSMHRPANKLDKLRHDR